MQVPGEAARLRIYIGANDAYGDQPLADALVYKAQELGLAGATAGIGLLGYGAPKEVRPADLPLSQDRPVIVEIVDSRDRIDAYLAAVEPMLQAGLVTVETIQVLRYGAKRERE